MKPIAIAAALAALLTPALASAHLAVGANAPAVRTQGALSGRVVDVDLRAALRRGPVVLYFYPAAFTGGCDAQAKEFSEAADSFAREGATIIGMSGDPIDKLQRFSTEKCAGKFAVGTATAATIRAYDVGFKPPPNFPAAAAAQFSNRSDRTTYVITPDGKVSFVYSNLSPRGHVEQSLAAVRTWRAAHPVRRRG